MLLVPLSFPAYDSGPGQYLKNEPGRLGYYSIGSTPILSSAIGAAIASLTLVIVYNNKTRSTRECYLCLLLN